MCCFEIRDGLSEHNGPIFHSKENRQKAPCKLWVGIEVFCFRKFNYASRRDGLTLDGGFTSCLLLGLRKM